MAANGGLPTPRRAQPTLAEDKDDADAEGKDGRESPSTRPFERAAERDARGAADGQRPQTSETAPKTPRQQSEMLVHEGGAWRSEDPPVGEETLGLRRRGTGPVRVQFPKKGSARRGKFQDVDELSVADRYTHIRALEDEDPEERDADADEVNPQRRTQSLLHQQSPDGLGCMMSLPPSQSVTLQAHDTHVLGVWMTHDGKRMASSAKDGRVKLWDTATGAVVANLGGHHLTVNDVCVSSDGRWVATASHDNTVRLWSALSGALERELLGHQYHALSVAFSPDAQLLCSGGADKLVLVWEPASGKLLHRMEGHTNAILALSFSRAEVLASASWDNSVRLWRPRVGAALRTLEGHSDAVSAVAWLDERTVASAGNDRTVRTWDAETGVNLRIMRGHKGDIYALASAPGRGILASGSADNAIILWDARSGCELQRLLGHNDPVACLSFAPSGCQLLSGSWDGTLRLWDVAVGQQLSSLEAHSAEILSVSFSPLERRLVATGSRDGTVRMWDAESGRRLRVMRGHQHYVGHVAFSRDGRLLASCSNDRTVRVWLVETGQQLHVLQHETLVYESAFSRDVDLLATVADDGELRVWELPSGRLLRSVRAHEDAINSVAFTPDGRSIVTGSSDLSVKIWNAASGELVVALDDEHLGDVLSVAVSPDGRRLATGSADRVVRVWNLERGPKLEASFKGHLDAVNSLSWTADAHYLASGGDDNVVIVWDLVDMEPELQLDGHEEDVNAVSWSPDALVLASVSADCTLRLWCPWRLPSFDELAKHFAGHDPRPYCKALLQRHPALTALTDQASGRTVLHLVSRLGHSRVLSVLVDESTVGAHCFRDHAGVSPLSAALHNRHVACVEILLRAMPHTPVANREGLVQCFPQLAREYGPQLSRMLQAIGLDDVGTEEPQLLAGCPRVRNMPRHDVLVRGSQSLYPVGFWKEQLGEDASMTQGVLVRACVVGVPGIGGVFRAADSPLLAMVRNDLVDAICSPAVTCTIDYKWESFARRMILIRFFFHLVFTALFSVSTIAPASTYCPDYWGSEWFVLASDLGVLALSVVQLVQEVRSIRLGTLHRYRESFWSLTSISLLGCVLAAAPLRATCSSSQVPLLSIAALLTWAKLMGFARGFRETGMFLRALFVVTASLGMFLLVLFMLVLAYSHALYVLFRDSGYENFDSVRALLSTYEMLVGGVDLTIYSTAAAPALALVLLVTFTIFGIIVMLNLVIALVYNVFDRIQRDGERQWMVERAELILESELLLTFFDRPLPTYFPRYIHALIASHVRLNDSAAPEPSSTAPGGVSKLAPSVGGHSLLDEEDEEWDEWDGGGNGGNGLSSHGGAGSRVGRHTRNPTRALVRRIAIELAESEHRIGELVKGVAGRVASLERNVDQMQKALALALATGARAAPGPVAAPSLVAAPIVSPPLPFTRASPEVSRHSAKSVKQ